MDVINSCIKIDYTYIIFYINKFVGTWNKQWYDTIRLLFHIHTFLPVTNVRQPTVRAEPCPTHPSASRTWPALYQDPEPVLLLPWSFRVMPDPWRSSRSSILTPPMMLVLHRSLSTISYPDGGRRSSGWASWIGLRLCFLASDGFELINGVSILSSISWLVSPLV